MTCYSPTQREPCLQTANSCSCSIRRVRIGSSWRGCSIFRIISFRINKLTSLDIQQFYKDLLENGRIREDTKAKKPGLSSTTVHGIHVMLKSALKRAVQERLIPFNPAEFCIPPKITKPELQVVPSERYQSYLIAAEQRGVLPMFYLELATGLRKGEIAALLWSDYDAQTQTIHVTKQYLFYNGQGTVSPPKSSTSVRYVSIPEEAAKLLEQEHEKHPKNPYMFPSPVTGEMYHPDAIVKIHRKICKDIGLENVRFHDLRHPYVKHTTKNKSLQKQKSQTTNDNLIVWDFCFFDLCRAVVLKILSAGWHFY